MPIVHRNSTSDENYSLAVWASTEPIDELFAAVTLDSAEAAFYHSLHNEQRKREYLTVRRLLEVLCGKDERIIYNEYGKPRLTSGGYISVTHSKTLVGLIVSGVAEVGIDLEAMRSHIATIAPKFVSEKEREAFGNQLDNETLHLIWGAKEVLFKLYGKGEVDFKKDLCVLPEPGTKQVVASIQKNDYRLNIAVRHTLLGEFMLVWSCLATD